MPASARPRRSADRRAGFTIDTLVFTCPARGSGFVDLLSGRELQVVSLETVEEVACGSKVMVLSTPECDDKPLEYPLMFRVSDLLLLNKVDLLGHVDFDLARFRANVARVKARLPVIELSAKTGPGFAAWTTRLTGQVSAGQRRTPCWAV